MSGGYLLDASALTEVLRRSPAPRFVARLRSVPTADRWTSALVAAELMLAARRSANRVIATDVVRLLAAIRVAAFDVACARTFAKLRATMEWAGAPLSESDFLTAAVARTHDMTFVTRRAHLFREVPQLRVEDWTL